MYHLLLSFILVKMLLVNFVDRQQAPMHSVEASMILLRAFLINLGRLTLRRFAFQLLQIYIKFYY